MAFYDPLTDRWNLLSRNQHIMAAAAVVVILTLLLATLWIKPRWEERAVLHEDIRRVQGRLDQINKTLAQIEQFKKDLREIDVQLKQMSAVLPETGEIPELLRGVSNLGQQNGLEFLLFKPEKEEPRDFVTEIPVTVNLKGNFHQLGIFFDQVRRLPRLVNVRRLELGAYDEKTAQVAARFQFVTYTAQAESNPEKTPGAQEAARSAPNPTTVPEKKKTTP